MCFAGKTTLAAGIAARCGATVLPEYATLADLPPWPPHDHHDLTRALDHFLRLERDRAATAHAATIPLVVLDRSPLTLIAHEHGMRRLGVPADPDRFARRFSHAARTGDILRPDAYIYLHIPREVAAQREARRGLLPAHLTDPRTQAGITQATLGYLAQVPPERRLRLDGTGPPAALADTAAEFLATIVRGRGEADGAAPPCWDATITARPVAAATRSG